MIKKMSIIVVSVILKMYIALIVILIELDNWLKRMWRREDETIL